MARVSLVFMVLFSLECGSNDVGVTSTAPTVNAVNTLPKEAEGVKASTANVWNTSTLTATLTAHELTLHMAEALYAQYGDEQGRAWALAGIQSAYEAGDPVKIEEAEHRLSGRLFGSNGEVATGSLHTSSASLEEGKPVTVIFVNGMLVSTDAAALSYIEVKKRIAEAGLADVTSVYYFYNASAFYDQSANSRCFRRALQMKSNDPLLSCLSFTADITQALRQIADLENFMPVGSETEAKALAKFLRDERALGRAVVLVGHSQGNLMIEQALRELGTPDPCIISISLAAPLGRASWNGLSSASPLGVVVKGKKSLDPILILGFNDFPQIETSISRDADSEIDKSALLAVSLSSLAWIRQDMRLHHMVEGYMAATESRDAVRSFLATQIHTALANRDCSIPSGLRIYASSGYSDGADSRGSSDLWTVNPRSAGRDTLVGRIHLSNGSEPVMTDLAMHPDGSLWGISFDALYTIDKSTAVPTLFGTLPQGYHPNSLAFDQNGRLFAAGTNGEVFEVDIAQRKIVWQGSLGPGVTASGDLAVAPSGIRYAVVRSGGRDYLSTLDPVTGHANFIGQGLGALRVWGLSFIGNTLFGLSIDTSGVSGSLITIDTSTGEPKFIRKLAFNAFGAARLRP